MRSPRGKAALALAAAALALAIAGPLAPSAAAQFGVEDFDVAFTDASGAPVAQAGSHPYAVTTTVGIEGHPTEAGGFLLDEAAKSVFATQIAGLAGKPDAALRCAGVDFLTRVRDSEGLSVPRCPAGAALGTIKVMLATEDSVTPSYSALYNLAPPPGKAAAIGFWAGEVPFQILADLEESPPHRIVAASSGISQLVEVAGIEVELWGVPADPRHDPVRGTCLESGTGESIGKKCPASLPQTPFLTMPRACHGPLATSYAADSWLHPGALLANGEADLSDPSWIRGEVLTHDDAEPPSPLGLSGCPKLAFSPAISARPTSRAASSPTGLDFGLEVDDPGLLSAEGLAAADIEKVVATLPKGMTANPSVAEGLEVCSEAQLARETAASGPGAGCPDAAKIGTVEVETPLLEGKLLKGALYVAEPYENPFGSLIALYVVIENAELGVKIVQPLKVEPDPRTGQLITTAEEIPQIPFSSFRLHFREGGRSPLIGPPACGTYDGHDSAHEPVRALLYPSTGEPPVESTSSFEIVAGPGGGPCPPGGAAPFAPGFEAGTPNNSAGAYSPFIMRLTRKDGEQDLTRFSAVLPPGVVGKIAGLGRCPEAAIAAAKARTGAHGAAEELARPSCPASSRIGRTLAGAGVGNQLTYVPGSLYLAGPYNGDPLSVVAIVPGKAGPFDVGNIVVREALTLNPVSAKVEVDGAASDPIPHILRGIPLNVRDVRVHADRPGFTVNATDCSESATLATVFGGFLDVFSAVDDVPVGLAARYQAVNCAALRFKPKLAIKLKGGVRRGAHPALKAVVTPRPGQANFERAAVTLPRSAFLDQAHIRTICTRVQFAAGPGNGALCPKGAQYGYARAWSPLLDGPAQGPVYLRSSDNNLPDLVVALKGPESAPFDVELSARIDSVRGGIRSTFPTIPDIPVSRFVLDMQGAKKGLIVNSRHLCHKPGRNRARAGLRGQNGRLSKTKPRVVALTCAKKRKRRKAHRRHKRVALRYTRGAGR